MHTYLPTEDACPACGGTLHKLGEDVSEILERVPATYKVIRHVRVKMACTRCDVIVQAPASSRPIERGIAGPALLAHVQVSKFADHLPLYRQSEIFAGEGIDLDRSTLADWVGAASHLLAPLVEATLKHILAATKIHADDTPIPVLAPSMGKTKTALLWTYVRDDRPAGLDTPPAVWFAYSPDRKGEHPRQHLSAFNGTLQADGYAGFHHLYEGGKIREAACWAHVRRKFYDRGDPSRIHSLLTCEILLVFWIAGAIVGSVLRIGAEWSGSMRKCVPGGADVLRSSSVLYPLLQRIQRIELVRCRAPGAMCHAGNEEETV